MPKKTYKAKKRPTAFDEVLAARARERQAKIDKSIEDHLMWVKDHPSVHDRRPTNA